MPRVLGRKQIEARKFWRLTDSTDEDRDTLRNRLAEEVAAWVAAGGKITDVPIGKTAYTTNGGATMAKYRENGLKKIKNPKKEEPEDD